jgi:hypothetical protein
MPVQPIPIRPNAGAAIGEIQAVKPHPKRAQDAIISLFIQHAEDVAGLPNFVAPEAGHAIQVVVRRGRRLDLRAGARVQLTVRFEGDEHGGGYYANAADCKPIE